jgi:heterodisulfide reductase subunit B
MIKTTESKTVLFTLYKCEHCGQTFDNEADARIDEYVCKGAREILSHLCSFLAYNYKVYKVIWNSFYNERNIDNLIKKISKPYWYMAYDKKGTYHRFFIYSTKNKLITELNNFYSGKDKENFDLIAVNCDGVLCEPRPRYSVKIKLYPRMNTYRKKAESNHR